ncbi:MAG: GNAT family N-acetyltransferase [Microthrixaceae bacterium]
MGNRSDDHYSVPENRAWKFRAWKFRVREYRHGDAAQLAEIFFRAVREIAITDYSAEQVQAWAPVRPDASFFENYASDGREVFVAVAVSGAEDGSDRVLGYTDLESDGHIDHLYRHPDGAGLGVAAMLYLRLEESARSSGVERLFVEASELARRFFETQGFTVVRRRDFEVNGVALHNYAMQKLLTP